MEYEGKRIYVYRKITARIRVNAGLRLDIAEINVGEVATKLAAYKF